MAINQTLMQGLREVDMQGVINTYDLKPYYFPTLFPLKQSMTFDWKTLEAVAGLKIAADIVSRGATISKKQREAISKLSGEIPKVAVSKIMEENDLNEYDIALALSSNNPNVRAIVELWANDMDFCWTAVASRLEWMALKQISTGKISLDNTNNDGVVTEFDIDYQIPAAQKVGVPTSWSNASADPFKDLRLKIKDAKTKSISPKFAFMNLETFGTMTENEKVIKACASFASVALGVSQTPSLEQVNAALRGLPNLNGLQIVVIDQDITTEVDGARVTANPFETDVVTLTESKVLGNTFWKTPIDMKLVGSAAMKVMNGPVMIKKFSTEEPITEVTQGIANAFPAWSTSTRSVLMDVANTTFTK